MWRSFALIGLANNIMSASRIIIKFVGMTKVFIKLARNEVLATNLFFTRRIVQKLRVEYWEKIKNIKPENLVFLDETGILLGLTRTHSRSPYGTRVTEIKPFYRGAKVTAIGAISMNKVLAVMTMNDSMDGRAFADILKKEKILNG